MVMFQGISDANCYQIITLLTVKLYQFCIFWYFTHTKKIHLVLVSGIVIRNGFNDLSQEFKVFSTDCAVTNIRQQFCF